MIVATFDENRRLPFDQTCYVTRAVAYHEAGHAVVALACGVVVHYATTRPNVDSLGHIRHAPLGETTIEYGLLLTLAGSGATRRYLAGLRIFEEDLYYGLAQHDTALARKLLRFLCGGIEDVPHDRITTELARWRVRADRLVERHWRWIEDVAGVLEVWQWLTGDEIARLNPKRGHAR